MKKIIINAFNTIPTGLPRLLAIVLASISLLILFKNTQPYSGVVIVLGFLSHIAWKMLHNAVVLFPSVFEKILLKTWRIIATVRSFYKLPIELEFFYSIIIALSIAPILYLVIISDTQGFKTISQLAIIPALIAAPLDVIHRISWLLKKTWAKVIGKFCLAGIGIILAIISTSISRQITQNITEIDSQQLTEFVALLSSIFTPWLYIITLLTFIGSFALIEFTLLLAGLLIYTLLSPWAEQLVGKEVIQKITYRITTGNKINSISIPKLISTKSMLMLIRPMAIVITAAVSITALFEVGSIESPNTKTLLSQVIVFMHYHPNTDCLNIEKGTMIFELKDGKTISTYRKNNNVHPFHRQDCKRIQ